MHVIINTNKNFWRAIIMKCTFCGNENIVKTYFPIISYGDGGADISKEVDVYFCLDCGHYDFFSKTKVNRYYETITWIDDTKKKIEDLNLRLAELQNPMVAQQIKDKMQSVETKLKSVDITIRQQQALKLKLSKLDIELRNIPYEIKRIEEEIHSLEYGLKTKTSNFEYEYTKI